MHLLGSNAEEFDAVSVVSRRQKGAATKVNVSCSAMVKIYNHGMGGVDSWINILQPTDLIEEQDSDFI